MVLYEILSTVDWRRNSCSIELKGLSLKAPMHIPVACGAKRDQVLLGIVAALAAKLPVVNLQIRSRPAALAFPSVTP